MTSTYRWGRAAAALIGIAAVLVALVVVTHRRPASRAQPSGSDSRAAADRFALLAMVKAPVPLGATSTVTGDAGLVAQFQVAAGNEPGVLSYAVKVRNAGSKPFDGSLRSGVWLATDDQQLIGPSKVTGGASAAALAPGAETTRVLVFQVVSPTRLSITVALGQYYPTATWTLTDS